MVPWTHWREPRLGRLLTEWTSEFTVFNLVIRLSKGKQSALFRVSPVVSHVEQFAAVPGLIFSLSVQPTAVANLLFQFCSRDRLLSLHYMTRYQDMLAGMVLLSFGSLGEVNKSCTQLMNLSAVYAQFGLIDHGPVMGTTFD